MSLFSVSRFLTTASEACRGLPHVHQVLFFAIVAKWDPDTETSGKTCRHSYQALRERLEVESTQGRATANYTKPQIRRYLSTLAARGLIRWEGELVFRVPCLTQEKSVQNYEVTREVTREVTAGSLESRSTPGKAPDREPFNGHEGGPFCGHTPDADDDISGEVIHRTDTTQGGLKNLPFAAFFQSKGFRPKQITDARSTLQDWSARGVTLDQVQQVVALVDDRLQRMGNEKPWSPKYYDREIRRRLSSAEKRTHSSYGSDAGIGGCGGDEIDEALGGSLH